MNHENIELSTLSKSFEFEKVCRTIDELSVTDARETAKAFCKLYYKQQEVVGSLGLKPISESLEEDGQQWYLSW